jgi:hypothetical protein
MQRHPGTSEAASGRRAAPLAFAPPTPQARPNPSLSIFLGLYLLVLAFFILLVSLSTIEEMKARAVMDSLSATFGKARPSGTSIGPGNGDPALLFERDLTATFASLVHVAEVEIVKPGRIMRARLPLAAVFADGAAELRPALDPLLDRVVAAVSSPPGGLVVSLELALAPAADAAELPAARADGFVREMLARGAPPDRLAIALAPRAEGDVWLTFAIEAPRRSAAGGGRP